VSLNLRAISTFLTLGFRASNWLGGIGNYVDSWLRDQNKSSRPKATQATQPSSSSKPTSTAASITTSDVSLKPWESGGIFDEVVEAEVQRTKKRYTEVSVPSPSPSIPDTNKRGISSASIQDGSAQDLTSEAERSIPPNRGITSGRSDPPNAVQREGR